MNIKPVAHPVTPVEIKSVNSTRETKMESSHERDAQAFYGDPSHDQHKRKLKEEEVNEVVEHLKSLPFVKDSNWTIRLEKNGDFNLIYVEDSQGKVIRRIPEQDLWGLWVKKNNDQNKGNLLNKAL